MVRVRKLVLAIAAASALTSGTAHALGLGEIDLQSSLSQPLVAEIELLEVRDLAQGEVIPSLASPEEFNKAGVDRQYFLTDLKFTPVIKPNGKSVIPGLSDAQAQALEPLRQLTNTPEAAAAETVVASLPQEEPLAVDTAETILPKEVTDAVEHVIAELDAGRLRVATRHGVGQWTVHQWIKKAVLLSFRLKDNALMQAGELQFFDKVPTKYEGLSAEQIAATGVRVVPPAVARRGSYMAKGAILMPSYVNIGA